VNPARSQTRFLRLLLAAPAALAILLATPVAHAQVPRPDLWVTNGTVLSMAVHDDVLHVGGTFSRVGPPNGSWAVVDTALGAEVGPSAKVTGTIYVCTSDGSGGFYIGGDFRYVKGEARNNLARIDAQGNLYPWAPDPNGVVYSLATTGTLVYAGGNFTTIGGENRTRLAAFSKSTGLLTAWNPSVNGPVKALAVNGSNVFVGGFYTAISGIGRTNLCALDATSGLPNTWAPATNGGVEALAVFVRRDPTLAVFVYVGGSFTSIGGQARNNIASVDATPGGAGFGGVFTWNPSANNTVSALRVTGDTTPTIYAGGAFTFIGGVSRTHLATIMSTGTVTFWAPAITGTASPTVNGLHVDGNTAWIAGDFLAVNGVERRYLAAIDLTTGATRPWNPAAGARAYAIGLGMGGRLGVGGAFPFVGGVSRSNLAAFDLATGQPTAWNPVASASVRTLMSSGTWLYAAGSFTTINGSARPGLARLRLDGNLDGWNPGVPGVKYALATKPEPGGGNTIYVGGNFIYSTPTDGRINVAAFTDDPIPALRPWAPFVNGTVRSLLVRGNAIYLGGLFNFNNGVDQRQNLAAFDTSGALLPWLATTDYDVYTLAAGTNAIYAGGDFLAANNQLRNFAAAFDPVSGALRPWDSSSAATVVAILDRGDRVYLGRTTLSPFLSAVDPVSGATQAWTPAVGVPFGSSVNSLVLHEGVLYVGGQFQGAATGPYASLVGYYDGVTGVDDPGSRPSVRLRAAPNPFTSETMLRFTLPGVGPAHVSLVSVAGRRVRSMRVEAATDEEFRVRWDGRDDEGERVPPGIYFVRAARGGATVEGKVFRLR
jgi:hypothetical protein